MRRRSAAVVRFVRSSTRTGRSPSNEPAALTVRPSSICAELRKCCSASTSVGAIERALVAALYRHEQRRERDDGLARADVALQEPVHRCGRRHVAGDLGDRRSLIVREHERKLSDKCREQRAVDGVANPRLLRRERTLAGDEPDLHAEELVEDEPSPRLRQLLTGPRTMDRPQRDVARDEVMRVDDVRVGGERIGKPPFLALRERVRDQRAHLPRQDVGLSRLRIDGHDHAGLLVGDTRPAHDVDDRVGHLTLPAVDVELAEERGLGADAQLLLAPRLIEERDVQHGGAVVDDRFDDRLAVARPPASDRADLGEDGRLLPHRQRRDVGALGAVDPAAGVMLQQVEDVLDAHDRQAFFERGPDALQAAPSSIARRSAKVRGGSPMGMRG